MRDEYFINLESIVKEELKDYAYLDDFYFDLIKHTPNGYIIYMVAYGWLDNGYYQETYPQVLSYGDLENDKANIIAEIKNTYHS